VGGGAAVVAVVVDVDVTVTLVDDGGSADAEVLVAARTLLVGAGSAA
jgi:hypothetical protein